MGYKKINSLSELEVGKIYLTSPSIDGMKEAFKLTKIEEEYCTFYTMIGRPYGVWGTIKYHIMMHIPTMFPLYEITYYNEIPADLFKA